jgi:hypothetical protein
MRSRRIAWLFGLLCGAGSAAPGADGPIDLGNAVVVAPDSLGPRERQAVAMLVDEVERRCQIRWKTVADRPADPTVPAIIVGQEAAFADRGPEVRALLSGIAAPEGPEGYRLAADASGRVVIVAGNDERGVLYGVGRLLRELRMARGRVALPAEVRAATAPRVALRGHQLGYRPKTNSYDGWDLDQWEQYIRDLAVFGTNAIELIPPRSDDEADSPHFPRPPLEMMVGMSRLADAYGLDVWIWFPAMDEDYGRPETVEFALSQWEEVFRALPRIDAVFVPGGDPGHTPPGVLMDLLEKQASSLRRHHPGAQMWVSPQSFDRERLAEFLGILRDEPAWLSGIVFGPQVYLGLGELRRNVPDRYPIRGYPDITHSLNCQHPVPDWDLAYALTQEREPINPRPLGQAAIFRMYRPETIGFLTYSEGCNDDVNKFVWNGLGWDPDAPVVELLRQYGRYFIGDAFADGFAQGLLALERNWQGPLLTNSGVETTLRQFEEMQREGGPRLLLNWRFQQALYRAYYDAALRDRLIVETALESDALEVLRAADRLGSLRALDRAGAILSRAVGPAPSARRRRVDELAEALFQSIRMQLDAGRTKGQPGRGTTQETIDLPLNNRSWLEARFAAIRAIPTEAGRLREIGATLDRTDPGPGGFYDDLGDPTRQPHLVRGPGFDQDPDFRRSSLVGFDYEPGWPLAWCRSAQSLYDAPLLMRYTGLDRSAHYRVRVVYAGDMFRIKVALEADGRPIHEPIAKPHPPAPLEFEIPREATADGEVTLRWAREPGRGGNGRGCQVAEVWLIRRGGD